MLKGIISVKREKAFNNNILPLFRNKNPKPTEKKREYS